MNEGEKQKKKIYKRGDIVTFRLLKKLKYNDDVINFINSINQKDQLNVELIKAIELYAKFDRYKDSMQLSGIGETELSFFKERINQEEINSLDSKIDNGDEELYIQPKLIQIEEEYSIGNNILNAKPDGNPEETIPYDNVLMDENDAEDEIFTRKTDEINGKEEPKSKGLANAFRSLRKI